MKELDEILDAYLSTNNIDQLKDYFHKANAKYQEVIKYMGNELKKMKEFQQ